MYLGVWSISLISYGPVDSKTIFTMLFLIVHLQVFAFTLNLIQGGCHLFLQTVVIQKNSSQYVNIRIIIKKYMLIKLSRRRLKKICIFLFYSFGKVSLNHIIHDWKNVIFVLLRCLKVLRTNGKHSKNVTKYIFLTAFLPFIFDFINIDPSHFFT